MSRLASGLRAWVLQRASAVYLLIVFPLIMVFFLFQAPDNYQDWKTTLQQTWVSALLLIFVWALLLHAWIGVRDVLMDYVQQLALRLSVMLLFIVGLLGCGFWALLIIFKLQSGA